MLDENDRAIDKVDEDSTSMAMARRMLSDLIPQTFRLEGGAVFRQRFNPFIYRLEVGIFGDSKIDRRLLFGVAVLIADIEGRQGD